MVCDKCRQAGRVGLAQYVLLADVEELIGEMAGGVDAEEMAFLQWPRLCRPHHAQLSEDARMAYVPTADACPENAYLEEAYPHLKPR